MTVGFAYAWVLCSFAIAAALPYVALKYVERKERQDRKEM